MQGKFFERPKRNNGTRINRQIHSKQVFLIDEHGTKLGMIPTEEALRKASDLGLDLVEVAGKEFPPVCKLMNYGKHLFNMKKAQSKIRKDQKLREIKEIQIRPVIEEHDFAVKLKRLEEFVTEGLKVQVVLKFRGRQMAHPELGLEVLKKFAEASKEVAKVESQPKMEGKRAFMMMAPINK